MKIALAQYNYHVGNLSSNIAKIKSGILRAKQEGAALVVFSELAICGYPPKDLLMHSGFINACEAGIMDIAKECNGIAAIVGGPARNTASGRPFYNSAFFLADGKIRAQVNKTLLPYYDVFDEPRYFEPSTEHLQIDYNGFKIALTVCEDIWNELPHNGRLLHRNNLLDTLVTPATQCIINIAASPFSYSQARERKEEFSAVAKKHDTPLFYVNTLGANTDVIFDGGSLVLDKQGNTVGEFNYFTEDLALFELQADKSVKPVTNSTHKKPASDIELIYNALVSGIRDYFRKNNLTDAILGLSGGIDSALVLALAAEALGGKNVHALILPSRYTSEESLILADELVKNIGCPSETISIEDGISAIYKSLERPFAGKKADITEENIQSRIRSVLLMAMSNKMGYLLLNTSNKSELATGYGTLYGDMSGALSVIGDLYKTQVFELSNYINTIKPGLIPEKIITRPPSAELKPDQKDTDSLPEYEILDKVLYQYIDEEKSPADIKVTGANPELISKIITLVSRNEYKRNQAPPVLRISNKAFGIGRKMPIVAKHL